MSPLEAAPAPFDLAGPLPTGLAVLEASAGTGKTWSIASLAVRYVMEGRPIREILVVTFTRAATGELRDRIRERLRHAEELVAARLAGAPGGGPEPLLQPWADAGPAELRTLRHRLAAAAADFDAATVTTIHGFCDTVLTGLGVAGDVDGDLQVETDTSTLVGDVADDLLVAAVLRDDPLTRLPANDDTEAFGPMAARALAATVAAHPEASIAPGEGAGGPGGARADFARAVRTEIEQRKLRASIVDFDDLVLRLDRSLAADGATEVCHRLRTRFPVVLVDEFQDTDPVQWRVLRRLFAEPGQTLILIGDPKQAIYSFRGADVAAYLDARAHASRVATLAVNWRSDTGVLRALDALLRGATLGDAAIPYRPVTPAPLEERARLEGALVAQALRVRVAAAADGFLPLWRGTPTKDAARAAVARDLAAQTVALLDGGGRLVTPGSDRPVAERLHPGHLAVLVERNVDADLVQNELLAAGVPAVINGAGSVLATVAATEWRQLLEAIEAPSEQRVRTVARSAFVGWSDARLAAAGDDDIAGLTDAVRRWAAVLDHSGVAALLQAVTVETDLPARILARPGGERRMTDLHHVGQLLHAEASSTGSGASALATWLHGRVARTLSDGLGGADERTRRLETDADAVQVLTIHRAKGLEFPIVMLPFLWASGHRNDPAHPVCRDPGQPGRRIVDVGGSSTERAAHKVAASDEAADEELRQVYVALTRARHQLLVWWVGSSDSGRSALGRLLCRPLGTDVARPGRAPSDAIVAGHLDALAAAAPADVAIERMGPAAPVHLAATGASGGALRAARFERALDLAWRRLSYSALVADGHAGGLASSTDGHAGGRAVGSEPDGSADDERMPEGLMLPPAPPEPLGEPTGRREPVPLTSVPGGRAVGTLVHAVLEHLDFAAPDLDGAVRHGLAEASRRTAPMPGLDRDALTTGLVAALRSPLGPDIGVGCLAELARGDRLDELDFELPVAGGDERDAGVTIAEVADLLARMLPAGDALAAYPAELAAGIDVAMRGYLTGSIDLVVRAPGPDGVPRFHVVDYKTNRLGPPDAPLLAEHYRPSALAQAMIGAHYPLQALLYCVALHRYLRWRLPGYDPARHLGAPHYLFLRGMAGPDVATEGGRPCGVFAWTPPPPLVPALSDLLDGEGHGTRRTRS